MPGNTRCPVPVETVQFGWQATERRLIQLGCTTKLRRTAEGQPVITDGGNYVLDCSFGAIADAAGLAARIKAETGVVETGLFIGLATEVIVAAAGGVEVIQRA